MSVAAARTPLPTLWRGRGADLGPHVTRFPLEHRTLLHVLQAQAAQRGAQTWLTFDGRERLTFGRAWEQVAAVAHALIDAGAQGGQVALLLRNQIE